MKNPDQSPLRHLPVILHKSLLQGENGLINGLTLLFFWAFIALPTIVSATGPVLKNTGSAKTEKDVHQPAGVQERTNNAWQGDDSFISLFNGKDLSGWCYRTKVSDNTVTEPFEGKTESKDGRYMAKDGMLTINPWDESKGPHWINLWSLREVSGDFLFSVEFRASPNADSGIFLRGKQLQCRDYLVAGPYKELKSYKPQDWNKIEVVVRNNIAHCTCNGELLEEALQIPATGSIGLEADRGRMDYRNILIKVL